MEKKLKHLKPNRVKVYLSMYFGSTKVFNVSWSATSREKLKHYDPLDEL